MGILFYVQTFAKAREKGAYGAGSPDGDLGRDCGIYRMSVWKQGEDLEFTVTGEADIPAALKELIDKKREKPFKLTYADGLEMYIVIGEGPQKGGGYSVAVKELYETDNSIVIRTELTGPEAGEARGTENSYPVLIVKTEYRDKPVVFQ